MKLSPSEEQLMQHLWMLERGPMKDLINMYPEPKPAVTTIATLLKRMRDKGYIDYKEVGRAREYFPLVKKGDYFQKHVKGLIRNFFGNSTSQFASFFTQSSDLTEKELKDLRAIIDQELEKKRQS